jgi:hypothetical protein
MLAAAKSEPFAYVGTAGFLASLSLHESSAFVALLVGLATLLLVVTRWLVIIRQNGGFRAVFWPSQPIPVRTNTEQPETPRNP